MACPPQPPPPLDAIHTFNRTRYDGGIRYVTEPAVYWHRCHWKTRSTAPTEFLCVPVFLCSRPAGGGCQLPGAIYVFYIKIPQRKLAPWPLGSRAPAMAICISSPCPCSRLDSPRPTCLCTLVQVYIESIIDLVCMAARSNLKGSRNTSNQVTGPGHLPFVLLWACPAPSLLRPLGKPRPPGSARADAAGRDKHPRKVHTPGPKLQEAEVQTRAEWSMCARRPCSAATTSHSPTVISAHPLGAVMLRPPVQPAFLRPLRYRRRSWPW